MSLGIDIYLVLLSEIIKVLGIARPLSSSYIDIFKNKKEEDKLRKQNLLAYFANTFKYRTYKIKALWKKLKDI